MVFDWAFLTGRNVLRTSLSTSLLCFRISDNSGSSISGLRSGRMMLIFSAVSRTISKLSSSSSGLRMVDPLSNSVPLYVASRRDVPRLKKPVLILVSKSSKVSVKEARRGCGCLILGGSCSSQKRGSCSERMLRGYRAIIPFGVSDFLELALARLGRF